MEKSKKLNVLAKIILFVITIAWGSAFIILKETIKHVPAFYVLALRFIPASLILLLIFFNRVKKFITKKAVIHGIILGGILAVAYIIQTVGVMFTTASRNAFVTAAYCVMTPFLAYFINKTKIKSHNIVSAVLCLTGIGLVAFSSGTEENASNILLGDTLTLICAVFYALQIIYIAKFQKSEENSGGDDSMVLLIFELLATGVFCILFSLVYELPKYGTSSYSLNLEQLLKISYLMLVPTLLAQLGMIVGLKYTTENEGALILSLEAVFGVLFAVLIGNEKVSMLLGLGFLVIFIAELISELKIDIFKPFRKIDK